MAFVTFYSALARLANAAIVFVMAAGIETDTSVFMIVWPPVFYVGHWLTFAHLSTLTVYLYTHACRLV